MSWSLQDSSSLSPKVSRLQGKVTSWSEGLYALGPLASTNCIFCWESNTSNSSIHWPFQTVMLTILSSQASPDCNEVNISSWSFSCFVLFFCLPFYPWRKSDWIWNSAENDVDTSVKKSQKVKVALIVTSQMIQNFSSTFDSYPVGAMSCSIAMLRNGLVIWSPKPIIDDECQAMRR